MDSSECRWRYVPRDICHKYFLICLVPCLNVLICVHVLVLFCRPKPHFCGESSYHCWRYFITVSVVSWHYKVVSSNKPVGSVNTVGYAACVVRPSSKKLQQRQYFVASCLLCICPLTPTLCNAISLYLVDGFQWNLAQIFMMWVWIPGKIFKVTGSEIKQTQWWPSEILQTRQLVNYLKGSESKLTQVLTMLGRRTV